MYWEGNLLHALLECVELHANMKVTRLIYMDLTIDMYFCKALYFLYSISKDMSDVQLLLNP